MAIGLIYLFTTCKPPVLRVTAEYDRCRTCRAPLGRPLPVSGHRYRTLTESRLTCVYIYRTSRPFPAESAVVIKVVAEQRYLHKALTRYQDALAAMLSAADAKVCFAQPRSCLRRHFQAAHESDGYPRPPNIAAVRWQNPYAERLIGSIRRDCLAHVIVFGERHLRHVLKLYQRYYNESRTHLSLYKDAPITRAVETIGRIVSLPVLGGLHRRYARI